MLQDIVNNLAPIVIPRICLGCSEARLARKRHMAADLRALWEEFEATETPDAVFAKSLDRVQPVMANLMSGGGTWKTYDVTSEQLEYRVGVKVALGAPALWEWVKVKAAAYFG